LAAGSDVWVAVDYDGAHHVLVKVQDHDEPPPTTTHGLEVAARRHRVSGRPDARYIDLACREPSLLRTFAAVASDIARSVAMEPLRRRPALLAEALERWRWFWNVDPDELSTKEAVGLLAELWFLARWTTCDETSVSAWTAGSGARHDFQWSDTSVEVKGTSRRQEGGVVHHVQHLDQLADPETGELLLFSLHVVPDSLAGNSLPGIVESISTRLAPTPGVLAKFFRKLAERGYHPAHAHRYATRYRILTQTLYRVAADFPRLTSASFAGGLPSGVTSVGYDINMSACDAWRVADRPAAWMSPT
jgi:hypothetical protein